jgi:hypothetical protein
MVRHNFQACPVWIYTQSNITKSYSPELVHYTNTQKNPQKTQKKPQQSIENYRVSNLNFFQFPSGIPEFNILISHLRIQYPTSGYQLVTINFGILELSKQIYSTCLSLL